MGREARGLTVVDHEVAAAAQEEQKQQREQDDEDVQGEFEEQDEAVAAAHFHYLVFKIMYIFYLKNERSFLLIF